MKLCLLDKRESYEPVCLSVFSVCLVSVWYLFGICLVSVWYHTKGIPKGDPRYLLFGIPFLMPLEIDFYAILGANLRPQTHQNPPKIDAKRPSILGFNF